MGAPTSIDRLTQHPLHCIAGECFQHLLGEPPAEGLCNCPGARAPAALRSRPPSSRGPLTTAQERDENDQKRDRTGDAAWLLPGSAVSISRPRPSASLFGWFGAALEAPSRPAPRRVAGQVAGDERDHVPRQVLADVFLEEVTGLLESRVGLAGGPRHVLGEERLPLAEDRIAGRPEREERLSPAIATDPTPAAARRSSGEPARGRPAGSPWQPPRETGAS